MALMSEEEKDRLWNGALDLLREQGLDPDEVVREAGRKIDAWRKATGWKTRIKYRCYGCRKSFVGDVDTPWVSDGLGGKYPACPACHSTVAHNTKQRGEI